MKDIYAFIPVRCTFKNAPERIRLIMFFSHWSHVTSERKDCGAARGCNGAGSSENDVNVD